MHFPVVQSLYDLTFQLMIRTILPEIIARLLGVLTFPGQKQDKLAIVLGTEGDGLSPVTIAQCDYTVKIPMSHGVDSLNVAAAGAVAFWQLRVK